MSDLSSFTGTGSSGFTNPSSLDKTKLFRGDVSFTFDFFFYDVSYRAPVYNPVQKAVDRLLDHIGYNHFK